jgi:hypothetical protein
MPFSVLLPVLLGLQSPVGLNSSITYSKSARSVGAVLNDLSKLAQVDLKAKSESAREIVLVSVHDLPLKSLMDKLAFVTSCEWDRSGSTYFLEPAQSVRSKEEAKEAADRTNAVIAAVHTKEKNLEAMEKTSSTSDGKNDSGSDSADLIANGISPFGGPADERAITSILQMIDPSTLAEVQPGYRGVWATNNATQTQFALGEDASGIINQWITAHNASVPAEAKTAEPSTDLSAMPPSIQEMLRVSMSRVTEPVYKAILVAEPSPFMSGVVLRLKAFDRNGKILLSTQSNLGKGFMAALTQLAENAKKAAGSPDTASPPIEFSPLSRELQAMTSQTGMAQGKRSKPSPQLQDYLMHPVNHDPLGLMPTDIYMAVAKNRGREIVADLPDSAYGDSDLPRVSNVFPKTVQEAETEISKKDVVTATDDGQFLYLRPAQPAFNRKHRVDRFAIETLLQSTEAKFTPSLDDMCNYAMANDDPTQNGVAATYLGLVCPSAIEPMMMNGGQMNWNLYRLYGSLSAPERQTLVTGGALPFSNLSGASKEYASAYLFGPDASISPDSGPAPQDFFTKIVSKFMGTGSGSDYRDEATEVMPNGLPENGAISCNVNAEPVAYLNDGSGMLQNWTFGPQELALFRLMSSMPQAQGGSTSLLPKYGLLGTRQRLNLIFHIAPKISASGELIDSYIDRNAEQAELANLPTDFEAKINSELQVLKKSAIGQMMQMAATKQVSPP